MRTAAVPPERRPTPTCSLQRRSGDTQTPQAIFPDRALNESNPIHECPFLFFRAQTIDGLNLRLPTGQLRIRTRTVSCARSSSRQDRRSARTIHTNSRVFCVVFTGCGEARHATVTERGFGLANYLDAVLPQRTIPPGLSVSPPPRLGPFLGK